MSDWPEHDKLTALEGKNETVGDFIEWLRGQGVSLMVWEEIDDDDPDATEDQLSAGGYYRHDHRSTQALIAAHFGIDERKLEAEKRELLEAVRGISAKVFRQKAHTHELHRKLRGDDQSDQKDEENA